MLDLICIGEMLIDFLSGESAGAYIRKAGGAPANVAIAAARNGLLAGFCGRVGDDGFGRFLLDTLAQNNVTVLCPTPVKQAVTTMAFVTLNQDGERSFTFARKPGADMFLTCEDVETCGIDRARAVHAGSFPLSKPPASNAVAKALALGAQHGKLVSFDVNYRELIFEGGREAARQAVDAILPHVDLLKLSEEEADFAGGHGNMFSMMESYGIAVVVETLGAGGARCFFQGQSFLAAGLPARCVDATGAGDAFWGAFLARLLHNGIHRPDMLTRPLLQDAMLCGNIAGRLCVQKKGAIESLPTWEQIQMHRKELGL